jgi:hypothetical protein
MKIHTVKMLIEYSEYLGKLDRVTLGKDDGFSSDNPVVSSF